METEKLMDTKPDRAQVEAPLGDQPDRLRHAYLIRPNGQVALNGTLVRVEWAWESDERDDGRQALRIVWADSSRDSLFPVDAAGVSGDEASYAGPQGQLRLTIPAEKVASRTVPVW